MKRTFQGKISNILAIFLILPILFLSFPFVTSAKSISDLQDELNALDQKIAEQEKAIKKKQAEAASLSNQVATFNSQIYQTQLEINRTQADINLTQAEIDKLNSDIAKKESELKIQKKTLEKAAILLYEEQDRSMLELVLTSDSINEIVDRSEYLNTVQVKIDESMVEIEKIQKKLAEKKKEQEGKKKDLEGKNATLSEQRNSLSSQKSAVNNLLVQTKGKEAEYQKILKEKERQWESANSELRKAEEALNNSGAASSGSGYSVPYWPLHGRITAVFGACGCEAYICGKCHTGIDIAAALRSTIKAAKSGTVISTVNYCQDFGSYTCGGGYGNHVRVQHDDGYVAIYGHFYQGTVSVNAGQRVEGGQTVLGQEGSSGYSTGPHLHFEIRTSAWGTPVRPLLP